jgi:predicted ATPase
MVAELAPLDILLRRRLRPGDFLIIDEPEAHLHPENQRRIARVIVRLVRVGVRVVCTTHSSTFLHQISNHLLASAASADARMSLGFDKNDVIVSDEVGVYLFGKSKAGTRVRSVPIEPGFGISEDEFVRVAEEIGDESYTLASAVGAAIGGRE